MGLYKVQKHGKDENTKLSYCKTVVVNKDWKTALHLLHSQAKDVE